MECKWGIGIGFDGIKGHLSSTIMECKFKYEHIKVKTKDI